jgi:hypothetical protein
MIFGENFEGEWQNLIREKKDGWETVEGEEELDWLIFEEEQDEGGLEEHLWENTPQHRKEFDKEDEWEEDYIPKYGTRYNRRQRKNPKSQL